MFGYVAAGVMLTNCSGQVNGGNPTGNPADQSNALANCAAQFAATSNTSNMQSCVSQACTFGDSGFQNHWDGGEWGHFPAFDGGIPAPVQKCIDALEGQTQGRLPSEQQIGQFISCLVGGDGGISILGWGDGDGGSFGGGRGSGGFDAGSLPRPISTLH
jgi:hypothetical protein